MERNKELENQVKWIKINAIFSISKWKKKQKKKQKTKSKTKKQKTDRPSVLETIDLGDGKPTYF